jgi:hypothetical protein
MTRHLTSIPLLFVSCFLLSACSSGKSAQQSQRTSQQVRVAVESATQPAMSPPITATSTISSKEQANDMSAPGEGTSVDKNKIITNLKMPENFIPYASESIGDAMLCTVGAATDDDGLNQKPVVYVADAASKRVIWVARLDVPPDTYQSRATHCNRLGDAVFVLLQSDTQSEQTLSQTLLRAVKLDAVTGAVQTQHDVDVPTAYTAWVEEGANHFQWQGQSLIVSGGYRMKADQYRPTPFTVRLNNNLLP